ncbi:hypothetical protein [Peredibacter starrii]|uniref:Peptidase C1A papain C-terminal domain-containing protein n=1 Tax=Peredibacter starrii TaxID=28202 RepID=A0AAX4HU27_9BACT|nr:hypothetical protein [Peredibacter starrii]WPU66588.1 hypothetical protein SOO65_07505 [Peredibacter starrii]
MTKETCGKVDLAPKLGPVHNQTGGTCYAYVALDLLNFDADTRYSALYLAALKEYKAPPENPIQCTESSEPPKKSIYSDVGGLKGGTISAAVKLGMEKGLCPESLVPATDGVLKKDYKKLLEYYAEEGPNLICDDKEKNEVLSSDFRNLLSQSVESESRFVSDEVKDEVQRMYPTLSAERIKEIADTSKNLDEFVKRLNDDACQGKIVKDVPKGKTPADISSIYNRIIESCSNSYIEEDRASLLDMINKSLDKGKPTGIAYVTGGLVQPPKKQSHGYHAGVVGGRAWLEEKREGGKVIQEAGCYYTVKNSWGPDWKVPSGLKAKSSSEHPGYFIVSEKQLMEHVYGTTTID